MNYLLQRFKRIGLRTKFILPISAMLIASSFMISTYLLERQADGFRRELESSSETLIRVLALQAESGVLFENTYELDDLIKELELFENVHYARITNISAVTLAEFGQWASDSVIVLREIGGRGQESRIARDDYYVVDQTGTEYIEINHPIVTRYEPTGRETLGMTGGSSSNSVIEIIGSLKLIITLASMQESIQEAEKAAVLLTMLVTAIAVLVLTFFVRVVTRPVKMLVEITDQVSRGDLSKRVNITQQDEFGHLAVTFNRMIESLQLSRDEIEEYNRTLEQKIIERTKELDEAQSQLVQSEKMSAIGQLAAGVAHELNNPLGGILGYAQFSIEKLKKMTAGEVTEKQLANFNRYLADIETQARRCKAIVQNLLRFSRASHTSDFELVNVNTIIEETAVFIEHQYSMNRLELIQKLDPDMPDIMGNSGQLQQVLTNLFINALHASSEDSTVEIVSHYSKPVGEFSGTIEMSVTDHGTGIPQEIIGKIFEPFFTTKDVGKGTGLGLSVSYGIVREHGGEIKVDSVPGEGTNFTIIIPIQEHGEASDNFSETLKKTASNISDGK